MLPVVLFLSGLALQAAAHGYLTSPPPRGIEKEGYQIDDLKSPNRKGMCRGEPQGKITSVTPGQMLTLGLKITAPHKGPCKVTVLDADLTNESEPFAEKMDCAAPGGPGFWQIKLPSDVSGHKVLRWQWEGQHVYPGEPYEQCIDVNFGGDSYEPPSDDTYTPEQQKKSVAGQSKKQKSKPAASYKPAQPKSYKQDEGSDDYKPKNTQGKKKGYGNKKKTKKASKKHAKKSKKCKHGAQKCLGDSKFAVCNWGKWVNMNCGVGTACQSIGRNAVTCGYAD
jgi:predicted carbohydrate-binding protein with CBM5 and CBM33 domain